MDSFCFIISFLYFSLISLNISLLVVVGSLVNFFSALFLSLLRMLSSLLHQGTDFLCVL